MSSVTWEEPSYFRHVNDNSGYLLIAYSVPNAVLSAMYLYVCICVSIIYNYFLIYISPLTP